MAKRKFQNFQEGKEDRDCNVPLQVSKKCKRRLYASSDKPLMDDTVHQNNIKRMSKRNSENFEEGKEDSDWNAAPHVSKKCKRSFNVSSDKPLLDVTAQDNHIERMSKRKSDNFEKGKENSDWNVVSKECNPSFNISSDKELLDVTAHHTRSAENKQNIKNSTKRLFMRRNTNCDLADSDAKDSDGEFNPQTVKRRKTKSSRLAYKKAEPSNEVTLPPTVPVVPTVPVIPTVSVVPTVSNPNNKDNEDEAISLSYRFPMTRRHNKTHAYSEDESAYETNTSDTDINFVYSTQFMTRQRKRQYSSSSNSDVVSESETDSLMMKLRKMEDDHIDADDEISYDLDEGNPIFVGLMEKLVVI